MNPKRLIVTAHARDCNSFSVYSDNGHEMLHLDGYVVGGLGVGRHGSDDIELTVDIETGTIVGWNAEAVKARIAELMEEQGE